MNRVMQGPEVRAQTERGTTTENTSRSAWRCRVCASEHVQVSLPVWFHEYQDGELRAVEVDAEADVKWWYCEDCGETGDGEPVRVPA